MALKSPMTYKGALRILGEHDRPLLEVLDRVLGGIILASGVNAASVIFGWIDQKTEAIALTRKLLDIAAGRLHNSTGQSRQELVVAAHTTIVGASLFDALENSIRINYKELSITDEEKRNLIVGKQSSNHLKDLYLAEIPIPSAMCGFRETLAGPLKLFFSRSHEVIFHFLEGLSAWESAGSPTPSVDEFTSIASAIYEDYYIKLAGRVPEFLIWISLDEHAATRTLVKNIHSDLLNALISNSQALSKLEALLEATRSSISLDSENPRDLLAATNQGVLREPLVSPESVRLVDSVSFPTVADGYVTPSFHLAMSNKQSRPAQEDWWQKRDSHDDLDIFLAAHFSDIASTKRPLLLLGHPGAGKSLLTKVLAARLPVSNFTVVRVPLRRVDADAPIYEQIEQALRKETNGRVNWGNLTRSAKSTVRVVILDGFDELLQAASVGKSGYLQQIAEFQRLEAEMGTPVAVVVTSRTLVADRATIPDGCVLVKIKDFSDSQIAAWLRNWNSANAKAIASGHVHKFSLESAQRHRAISTQPLLLLMLALYSADLNTPDLAKQSLSTTGLYGKLLENFILREITKDLDPPTGMELEDEIRLRLWHLGVAAFAIFNRGRQYAFEEEINADFSALPNAPSTSTIKPAQQTVGQFFFVYTAAMDDHRGHDARRCYEFLHATFGEYLVATHSVALLIDLADSTTARRVRIDDDLIFALLSHQVLSTRERILQFASELFHGHETKIQESVISLINQLISGFRNRYDSGQFSNYRPSQSDNISQLANYSANLTLLRVSLADNQAVYLDELWPIKDANTKWQSVVWLWRMGIDSDGWSSMLQVITLDTGFDGSLRGRIIKRPSEKARNSYLSEEIDMAYLLGNQVSARLLRVGRAAAEGTGDFTGHPGHALEAYFYFGAAQGTHGLVDDANRLIRSGREHSISTLIGMLRYLRRMALVVKGESLAQMLAQITQTLSRRPRSATIHDSRMYQDLAIVVAMRPEISSMYPELWNLELYARGQKTPARDPINDVAAAAFRLGEILNEDEYGPRLHGMWNALNPSVGEYHLRKLFAIVEVGKSSAKNFPDNDASNEEDLL